MKRFLLFLLIPILLGFHLTHKIYEEYKYAHLLGKSVVRLIGAEGGGTGFQVSYKDHTFIMTNDHVCGLADKDGFLMVDSPFAQLQKSRIQWRSGRTDLCLLGALEELPALELGNREFKIKDNIVILGHPLLKKITRSLGKIKATGYIDVIVSYIQSKRDREACHLPKNRIVKGYLDNTDACVVHVREQTTSAIIYPGNSGSPVLGNDDKVYGVAFASDQDHNSFIIPLNDMRDFLDASLEHSKLRDVY